VPLWIAKRAAPAVWRRIPWRLVWAASLWLVDRGRDRIQANLTSSERSEFLHILARSRGRPGNLEERDRTRIRNIAGKAIRG
jgi:hypothetical protein